MSASTASAISTLATSTATDSSLAHVATTTAAAVVNNDSRSGLASIAKFLPAILLKLISLATISIPLLFYRILTMSFTLHLNFTSLLVIVGLGAVGAYLVLRYRYLNKYSRLKRIEPPQSTSSFFDLHPDDPNEEDSQYKAGFKNYPDEFLSAFLSSIKIFGYLEQHVFHELARHLQTKKLLAGDTLFRNPDQERSFYIVVHGHVQLFVKPDNHEDEDDEIDDEDMAAATAAGGGGGDWTPEETSDYHYRHQQQTKRGYDRFKNYTLINEVGAGGTLSSLFTILSIFRESFLRQEAKEQARKRSMRQHLARMSNAVAQPSQSESTIASGNSPRLDADGGWRTVFPNLQSGSDSEMAPLASSSTASLRHGSKGSSSVVHPLTHSHHNMELADIASDMDDGEDDLQSPRKLSAIHRNSSASFASSGRYRSVHPNIVARATVDTTLAVIPEEAFHKLTAKFPKAAAHIVQVILTRFQRVTLMTGHRYLGLTNELLRLEKLVNESASMSALPENLFVPGGMERLRRKFAQPSNESGDTSSPSVPSEMSPSESSGFIQAMDIPSTPSLSIKSGVVSSNNSAASPPIVSGHHPLGQSPPQKQRNNTKLQEYSVEDDEHLRSAVRRCLATALGMKPEHDEHHDMDHGLSSQTSSPHPRHASTSQAMQPPPESSRYSSRYYYPMDLFSVAGTADTSASPSLGALSVPYDEDIDALSTVSSAQSGTDSTAFTDHHHHHQALSANDVQILFFAKDAVLVKEGEHNNGLFFVIDGLLEVSMTPADAEDISLERDPAEESASSSSSSPGGKRKSSSSRDDKRKGHRRFTLSPSPTPSTSTSSISSQISDRDAASGVTGLLSDAEEAGGIVPMLEGSELVEKHGPVLASKTPAGRASQQPDDKDPKHKAKKPLFVIRPGGLAGYLEALTGHPSFVEIRAKRDTYVGYLSRKSLDRIIDKHPSVMLKLAQRLVGLLSPLILHIDLALDWMQVHSSQIICREGQPSDSIYMVLHGRLRTIRGKKEGGIEIIGEFGRGDCVCELEALAGIKAPSTLHAIRDSELARLPKTLFNALALRHPEITLQISRMVASRSLELMTNATPGQGKNMFRIGGQHSGAGGMGGGSMVAPTRSSSSMMQSANVPYVITPELYGHNNANLKTVGIIPVNASVPVTEFAENLKSALVQTVGATCALLNSATITSVMGKHAFSRLGKLKLASWLAEQEEKFRIVLYLADSGVKSQWTRTCIRQADTVLLVGLGDGDPSVGEYERFMINMKTTARKELVLLHGERSCTTGTTRNWLKNRLWIQAHHHIFMPMRKHATLANERLIRPPWLRETGRKMTENSMKMMKKAKAQLEKYHSVVPTFGRLLVVKKNTSAQLGSASNAARDDFARLARRLCGKSVALVLGGGGARGISHIGVIQALEEANVPIDIIGGTSIGSFVGGLYARNRDLVSTIARSKMFSSRMTSIWRNLMDLTYPLTAWFTGHEFNRSIFKCLGDSQIEDFWLPYFAVTTNITYSRMEVHTTGYAWRYIRASMSLSGYMPPICENGNMLVDGGYMDNLPVSVAKSMGADIIIAVDVASEDDTSPVHYGDSVSGWWALLYNFSPFRSYNVPSIAEIQSRLAYVSSVSKLEEAKVTDGTLYVKMPVQQWGTLEFNKFVDIMQLGYDTGRQIIDGWRKAGYASGCLVMEDVDLPRGKQVKGTRGRRNSI